MSVRQRWVILGGLLASAVAAAALTEFRDAGEDIVAPARTTARSGQVAATAPVPGTLPQVRLEKMKSRSPGEMTLDPFSGKPPSAKGRHTATQARRAVAPAMPFVYAGRFLSGADTAAFLMVGDRNLVVREGDTVDSAYRVEHIDDRSITLNYLPLDERQTIIATDDPQ